MQHNQQGVNNFRTILIQYLNSLWTYRCLFFLNLKIATYICICEPNKDTLQSCGITILTKSFRVISRLYSHFQCRKTSFFLSQLFGFFFLLISLNKQIAQWNSEFKQILNIVHIQTLICNRLYKERSLPSLKEETLTVIENCTLFFEG